MKKLIILMVIAIAISDYGCRNADDYVILGQLAGTAPHSALQKVKGKVQEITQHNFWAKEENGKVVRGNVNPLGDKYQTFLFPGFREEYNSSGTVLKHERFNVKGETTDYWTVEAEGHKIIKIIFSNDTLKLYSKNTYSGNNLTEVKFFDSKNDTLWMSVVYEYDQNGNRIKNQNFNYKNEPGEYTEFSYTSDGVRKGIKRYSKTGEMTLLNEYSFNDKGKIIGNHSENFVKGEIIDFEHRDEYDNKGNWIKSITYIENKPYEIREREIKYYK